MNDDTQESGRRRRYFRYAVFTLAAVLVVSLGFVMIPREPDDPAPPAFSEQARAAAYSDAVMLGAAVHELQVASDAGSPAGQAGAVSESLSFALGRTVTLLTVQARALMLPDSLAAAGAATSSASAFASASPFTPPVAPASTTAGLAAALHASGVRRISDAGTADGGPARLLAGVGTAQILAAEQLAVAAGIPLEASADEALPSPALPSPVSASPGSAATAGCTPAATGGSAASGGGTAGQASALTAILDAELELVYAYQAALPRLGPGSAAPASDFLARHEALRDEAEGMAARCAVLPPTPAGYVLDQPFLTDPAAALGAMEAAALPVYGDAIALSDGAVRAWAVSALQAATRRTAHWGAPLGPVPGVVLDEARLPELPGPPEQQELPEQPVLPEQPGTTTANGTAPAGSRQP
ncbi:DUF4439 domain-containing protein [Pseudarthrobacter sulfonivorans]|uniref:DUF4439 domain-containing protein n=1 Tax=Pseudarthrobacter sulfonivorans TaxID=121292 RepID=UPI0027854FA0|nr:DUF4439 domain-containing protein [Pseudarthrobacter sulfonivorans]MDP9999875.1 hypothetical protein [Pseudarthrobacter sulfonivorans]